MQFLAFDLQPSSSGYCLDSMTVIDGDGTILMEKTCGSINYVSDIGQGMAAIRSSSNTVKLYFSTDRDRTESGWSISWIAITEGLQMIILILLIDQDGTQQRERSSRLSRNSDI